MNVEEWEHYRKIEMYYIEEEIEMEVLKEEIEKINEAFKKETRIVKKEGE